MNSEQCGQFLRKRYDALIAIRSLLYKITVVLQQKSATIIRVKDIFLISFGVFKRQHFKQETQTNQFEPPQSAQKIKQMKTLLKLKRENNCIGFMMRNTLSTTGLTHGVFFLLNPSEEHDFSKITLPPELQHYSLKHVVIYQ